MTNTKVKVLYLTSEDEILNEEGKFITYGIKVVNTESEMFCIKDISPCREYVEKMAELFNKCELSCLHIMDVIADIL